MKINFKTWTQEAGLQLYHQISTSIFHKARQNKPTQNTENSQIKNPRIIRMNPNANKYQDETVDPGTNT